MNRCLIFFSIRDPAKNEINAVLRYIMSNLPRIEDFFGVGIVPDEDGLFNLTEMFERESVQEYGCTWEGVLEEAEKNGLFRFLRRVLPGVDLYRCDEKTGDVWVQYPVMLDFLRSHDDWILWKSTKKLHSLGLKPQNFSTLHPMADTTQTHANSDGGGSVDGRLFGVWLAKSSDDEYGYYEVNGVLASYGRTWKNYRNRFRIFHTFIDTLTEYCGYYHGRDDGEIYASHIVTCDVLSYCDARVRASILLLLTPEPYISRMFWKSSPTWRTLKSMSSFCRTSFCRGKILARIFGLKATATMTLEEVGLKEEASFAFLISLFSESDTE
jgi:hypothetical protein